MIGLVSRIFFISVAMYVRFSAYSSTGTCWPPLYDGGSARVKKQKKRKNGKGTTGC